MRIVLHNALTGKLIREEPPHSGCVLVLTTKHISLAERFFTERDANRFARRNGLSTAWKVVTLS